MTAAALPVLYSFRRCPYAMRARLALAASGEPHTLREVVLRDKPAELLAASPKGTVPVLLTADGQVIDQSLEIMLWALRRRDPLGWMPTSEVARAEALDLIDRCDTGFKPSLDRYKYPGRRGTAPDTTAAVTEPGAHAARASGAAFLHELEARLAQTPQLMGARPGLADAALMPFVRQFSMVDPAWFAVQRWPHLDAWLGGWTGSPQFADVMHKYTRWRPGDVVVLRSTSPLFTHFL